MNYLRESIHYKNSIGSWLEKLENNLELGHIKFTAKENLAPTSYHRGLFLACYYMKIANAIGLWNEISDSKRNSYTNFVKSFQKQNGYFLDYFMLTKMALGATVSMLPRGKVSRWINHIPQCIRAETRQASSTLLMVDKIPKYLLPKPFKQHDEAKSFISSLDWSYPWSAGSQISHVLIFYYMNSQIKNDLATENLIDQILGCVEDYQDKKLGVWFKGDVSSAIMINGAMKVLSIFHWTGKNLKNSDKIIDFALSQPFEQGGCSFLNRLYVIYISSKYCKSYKVNEIRDLAKRSISEVLKYKNNDGGFSFNLKKAQKRYYRAKVSRGGSQSDLHGTVMFTWVLAICYKILGVDNDWNPMKP